LEVKLEQQLYNSPDKFYWTQTGKTIIYTSFAIFFHTSLHFICYI